MIGLSALAFGILEHEKTPFLAGAVIWPAGAGLSVGGKKGIAAVAVAIALTAGVFVFLNSL